MLDGEETSTSSIYHVPLGSAKSSAHWAGQGAWREERVLGEAAERGPRGLSSARRLDIRVCPEAWAWARVAVTQGKQVAQKGDRPGGRRDSRESAEWATGRQEDVAEN